MMREALAAALACRPLPIGAAVLAYLGGAGAIGARLRAAARACAVELGWLRASAIGLSAACASHLSFGAAAGEATRVACLARGMGGEAPVARALAVLCVDRIADGVVILAMLLVAGAKHVSGGAPARTYLLGAGLGVIAWLGLRRLRRGLPPHALARALPAALPGALAAWVLDLLRLMLVGQALGLRLAPSALCVLALASLLGSQAPTPGGLGAGEAAQLAAGLALGLPRGPPLALVVLDRALTWSLGTALGLGALAALVPSTFRRRKP